MLIPSKANRSLRELSYRVSALCVFLQIYPAIAQAAQSAAVAPAPDEEIVVRADPSTLREIDREVYLVKDTPLAQTKAALEVIQNLPSVTVDATGQLRLLGSNSLQILIDGRAVPNAGTVLNSLQASQMERVEIITNPSAKFSAYGSAGIINIVLRRTFKNGLTGSSLFGIGNFDLVTGRATPTWRDGPWSVSLSPVATSSSSSINSEFDRFATTENSPLGRNEQTEGRGKSRIISAGLQIGFEPSSQKRYSLNASASRSYGSSDQIINTTSARVGPTSFLEIRSASSRIDSKNLSVERKVTGDEEGEEFRVSASVNQYRISTDAKYLDLLPNQSQFFATDLLIKQRSTAASVDYDRPLSNKSKLSVGLEVQGENQIIADRASGSLLSGPVNIDEGFSGRWFDTSIYATLQSQIGSIKVLSGLRVQRRIFNFEDTSGVDPVEKTLAFPSLHLERKIGKLTATFSVSERVDWPSIGQFIPYRRVTGPTTVDTGNALLEPERSRGIETGARFSLLEQQVAFTLYDRRKKDVRETSIIVDENGDILSIPINLGDRSSRGGQVSVRGKLSTEIGYSASAWMASAEFNRLDGGSIIRARAKEYGGNAQLEYTEGKQGEKGFGQATLNVRYQGPSQFLQSRTEGILAIDLAVTKYLTNKLSLVGALNRLIGNRKITTDRTATSFVERVTSNVNGPLIKLSLVYNLGK